MELADRVNRIQSSSVQVRDTKAKTLKAHGGDVIGFRAGAYACFPNLVGMENIKMSVDRIAVAIKTRKSRNLVRRCKAPHFFQTAHEVCHDYSKHDNRRYHSSTPRNSAGF